jgi:hypothetical protein
LFLISLTQPIFMGLLSSSTANRGFQTSKRVAESCFVCVTEVASGVMGLKVSQATESERFA